MDQLRIELEQVLFHLVQDLKIHKIDKDNTILEIDYNKFLDQIIDIIKKADPIKNPPSL